MMNAINVITYLAVLAFLTCLSCSSNEVYGQTLSISEFLELKEKYRELKSVNEGNDFGRRIATNKDGTIVVLPSRRDEEVFVYEAVGNDWKLQGTLKPEEYASWYGFNVDISADGKTIVVGSESQGLFCYQFKGSKWIPKGSMFTYQKYGNGTGREVKLSADGNTLAFTSYGATSLDGRIAAGATYIMKWNGSKWIPKGKPIYGVIAGHQMGYGMGFSTNGNRIVISSPYRDYQATKVFEFQSGQWQQIGKSFPRTKEKDGYMVTMSNDGSMVFSYNGENQVIAFYFEDGRWLPIELPSSSIGREVGYAVAISNDNKFVCVASPGYRSGHKYGKIYFYLRETNTKYRSIGAMTNTDENVYLGYSLDISDDNSTLIIGNMGKDADNKGSIFTYDINLLK